MYFDQIKGNTLIMVYYNYDQLEARYLCVDQSCR